MSKGLREFPAQGHHHCLFVGSVSLCYSVFLEILKFFTYKGSIWCAPIFQYFLFFLTVAERRSLYYLVNPSTWCGPVYSVDANDVMLRPVVTQLPCKISVFT